MSHPAPASVVICILVAAAVGVTGPRAEAQVTQWDLRVKILLRVLAFDRQLRSRVGKELTVGILHSERSGPSRAEKDEVLKALGQLRAVRVSGLPLRVAVLGYQGASELKAALGQRKIGALYVTAGLEADVGAIKGICRALRVSTMAGSRSYVESGLSVAVIVLDRRPRLVVNLPASKAEGMDLSAEMLGLADVIR